MNPTIWQVGAGEANRFYSDLFFKYDLMLMGPGRFGPYDEHNYRSSGWYKPSQIHALRSFVKDVKPGDIVIARNGHRAVGIGIVTGEYDWIEGFDDIHGWDLKHSRRVIWQTQLETELKALQDADLGFRPLFSYLKQIPMFTKLGQAETLGKLKPLLDRIVIREPLQLPDSVPSPITPAKLGEELFSRGLANSAVEKVILAIERQLSLLSWYEKHGAASERPSEHEVVAHSVLPLLLALGWSEQLLAIEWRKIDLCAFTDTPTNPLNCALVCEAKSAGRGLQGAFYQAEQYARRHSLSACNKLLLSDGGRFYIHERISELNFSSEATGYFNIRSLRTNHILPAGTNAVDSIMALTPARILRPI